MRFYLNTTVLEEALKRIGFLFDEFEEVVVWISGGKDSTVIFNLAMEVAQARGRLPLKVAFIDQEAEWTNTIDHIRSIMTRPDVEPYWYQMPIKLFNATSPMSDWLYCWDPKEEADWMRPKEDFSIKENVYGTDRFHELFIAIPRKDFKAPSAHLSGVRCEESPARFTALTSAPCYKWATWGKKHDKATGSITFYPLYDWSYTDIWKYIEDRKLAYNPIYDFQYRYGVKVGDMRVSNLHHETSVHALFYMQEVEPETHNKLTKRLQGIDSATKFNKADYWIHDLPYMFKDWKEFRDYLLSKLLPKDHQGGFRAAFKRQDIEFGPLPNYNSIVKSQINAILCNDWEAMTKMHNLRRRFSSKATRAEYYEKIGGKGNED